MANERSMVNRIMTVLDRCLEAPDELSLAALATASNLPKTTAWRIAESLVGQGLLARTASGYRGGDGLVDRGDQAARQHALRSVVVPELVELHKQTGAAVWAVDVRNDDHWTVVVSIYDRAAMSNNYSDDWDHDPRHPSILATALGQVALGGRPELVETLLRSGVPRLTRFTEVEPRRVLRALGRAADEGEVIEHGKYWLGWSCIAVPIIDTASGRVAGVLGVVDRTPRFVDYRFSRAAHATVSRLQSHWTAPPC